MSCRFKKERQCVAFGYHVLVERHNDSYLWTKKLNCSELRADEIGVRLAATASVWKCVYVTLGFLFVCLSSSFAADVIPVLEVGSQTFSNVTVSTKSPTHVFIKHSRGFAGLKLNELDHATMVKLGLEPPDPPKEPGARPPVKIENPLSKMENPFSNVENPFTRPELQPFQPKITERDGKVYVEIYHQTFELDRHFVKGLLWTFFCLWLLFCYCTHLICKKSGIKAGLACWLPIIQNVRLLKAAHMSGWWILLCLFVAPVSAIIYIAWSIKICQVRGKGFFTVLCLLLPVTSPLAYLYLALSSDGREDNSDGRVHLSYQTSSAQ